MKIKSFFQDVLGSTRVTKRRKDAIKNASSIPDGKDPINECARALHPGKLKVELISIRQSSPSSKTFTFSSCNGHIPLFKAGQYMTLEFPIGESLVTRTYSISSAPYQTRGDHPIVEITVKRKEGGLVSEFLFERTKIGDTFLSEIGLGQFFYEPLRDSEKLMLIAGGSGVTPFMSILKEIEHGTLNVQATLLYGSNTQEDIVLKEELDSLKSDKIKVIHVISSASSDLYEKGFIDASLIQKYQDVDMSYFICGPKVMKDFLQDEFKKLDIPDRRIRFDLYGQIEDISIFEDYPKEIKDKMFKLVVKRGIHEDVLVAKASESIAVALEKAGIKIHIGCRSGACGFCRIKVEKGDYFVMPLNDYRRAADKDFNYVHACSTYPLSDMTIKVNID